MLKELVEQDLTVRQIAERVGRSATTVRYWLRLHGLETTRAARRSRAVADEGFVRVCHRHGTDAPSRPPRGRLPLHALHERRCDALAA